MVVCLPLPLDLKCTVIRSPLGKISTVRLVKADLDFGAREIVGNATNKSDIRHRHDIDADTGACATRQRRKA